jgi:REP element-mobilizing transposase RayT
MFDIANARRMPVLYALLTYYIHESFINHVFQQNHKMKVFSYRFINNVEGYFIHLIHLAVLIPPKLSFSELLGRLKGQTAMKMLKQFQQLRKKSYCGNHFRPRVIVWTQWV